MYLETFQPGPNVTVASKLAARNNIYNAHIERLNYHLYLRPVWGVYLKGSQQIIIGLIIKPTSLSCNQFTSNWGVRNCNRWCNSSWII